MKKIFCLTTLLLLHAHGPALAQSTPQFAVGQAGTLSTTLTTSPAFPTIYDFIDNGIQPSSSLADSLFPGYPDGSQVTAHAQGTTGAGAPLSPQRVSASITSHGTNQYLALATTYSVSEWKPIPFTGSTADFGVKAHLSGSVSSGGGPSLFGAVNPVYVGFEINASLCRVEQGEYFVDQGLQFETSGTNAIANHVPQFTVGGSLTLDDWEESFDGSTITWATDVTKNIQFKALGTETYWVIISFIAGANVDSQGQSFLNPPITAAASFGNTFTLEFVPVNPADQMVPLPPRQLVVATASGSASAPSLSVTGQPGGTVTLETSADLQSWTSAATVSPFPGTWTPSPLSFAPAPSRFFRASQKFSP